MRAARHPRTASGHNNHPKSPNAAERLTAFLTDCGGALGQSGPEHLFRCPCHARHANGDANPSGNVRVGDDGHLLVKCRAGCPTEDIVNAIGWSLADLMPPRTAKASAKVNGKSKKVYATVEAIAAAAAIAKKGSVESTHIYFTAQNEPLFGIVRIRHLDGTKDVPQVRTVPGGWVFGGVAKPRPLYRLPGLQAASADLAVNVFEGEQKADLAQTLGFIATSTSQGAGNAKLTDFRPLAGRVINLFPDADDAGAKHMHDVAARAYAAGAVKVSVVTLPHLPPKGDLVDYYDALRSSSVSDEQIAAEVHRAISEAVEIPRAVDEEQGNDESDATEVTPKSDNLADLLVAMASEALLFHNEHDETYASFEVNGHRETWRIASQQFSRWLLSLFYRAYKTAVPQQPLATAIAQLSAMALFDGPRETVHTRLARTNTAVWVDLCNENWQAIEITPDGWRVVDEPPVRFIRKSGMKALPIPTSGFDALDPVFDLLHVEDKAVRLLLTAWLVNSLMPSTSYPLVAFTGEQGSGKSTICRALQRLVDPHHVEGRSPPRNEEDIAVAAQNAHILVYENLSAVSQTLSDALCRVATGAGFAARRLYTNDEERQLVFVRPVILNGIGDLATRSDLADRVIGIHLEPIPADRRQTEGALWRNFDAMHARLFGALLSVIAKVMGTADLDVPLERMAEYSQIGAKVALALGLPHEAFTNAYKQNRDGSSLTALESSAIGPVLLRLLRQKVLRCAIGSLLFELQVNANKYELRHPEWPSTPRSLANELRRLSPNLARIGITVQFLGRRNDGYWVAIERTSEGDVHDVHDVHGEEQANAE